MTRVFLAFALAVAGLTAQKPQQTLTPVEPPEEDASLKEKTEYTLNPLQAEKEYKIGLFYAKKGSWRAAAGRFEEAAKWNPGLLDAYLKLADAATKLGDQARVKHALEQFVESAPDDDKRLPAVKKRLGGAAAAPPPAKP